MKLHILNDLHIEFEDLTPPATDADVVILAGDIGVGVEGLRWAEIRFPDRPVIYVPGNHEFYHHAPSSRSVHPRYAPKALNPDFRPDWVVEI